MSRELSQCSMASHYLQDGRTALRTAIECIHTIENNMGCDGFNIRQAHDALEWSRRAIEEFSLALHVFENNHWVEEETIDKEIMKLLKAAVRLQGIVLYNLKLMQENVPTDRISLHEHMA